MLRNLLMLATALFAISQAYAKPPAMAVMRMGDGTVNGHNLSDYQFTWLQCGRTEAGWSAAPPLTEALVNIGDLYRHTQSSSLPDGTVNTTTTYMVRESLSPIRMEQRVMGQTGKVSLELVRELSTSGYVGYARQDDKRKSLKGPITSNMWHGGALGLPLATLEEANYPVEFDSSMIGFDGTYRTIARLAGSAMLTIDEQKVEALLVDVEWHHNESGDIYAPGPEGSGGRFWLVRNPADGVPFVPQYQTDSYLVTTLQDTCPESK